MNHKSADYVPVQDSYERRDNWVYGEDNQDGFGPLCIAECASVEDAEILVGVLNMLVLQRDNARFAAGILGDLSVIPHNHLPFTPDSELRAEIKRLYSLLCRVVDGVPEHMLDPEGEDNDPDFIQSVNNAKRFLGWRVE